MGVLKSIGLFVAIVLAILAFPLLTMNGGEGQRKQSNEGLPWQIEILPEGNSRVFGLIPGSSTLADAQVRFGSDVQVAMIIAPGENGTVEAYYEKVDAGFVTGKMVITLVSSPAQRQQMLQRARKAEYMDSSTRRIELSDEDLAVARQLPLLGIGFIPSVNLETDIVIQRFGVPAERIRSSEHIEHFLYPEKGLVLQLDAKGKELLQYVAPREFAQLRDPLKSPAAINAAQPLP